MNILFLRPVMDVWPYVRYVRGMFCYAGLDPYNKSSILKSYQEFTMFQHSWQDLQYIWVVTTWSDVGTHIMVKSIHDHLLLHFIVTGLLTKGGVMLRDPHDIAQFFDPNHNKMLDIEDQRRYNRLI